MHSYVVKTKSTGKRNVLLLSTLEPLLAVTHDDRKKPLKFIKFMTLRKEGQILQIKDLSITSAKYIRWAIAAFSYIFLTIVGEMHQQF